MIRAQQRMYKMIEHFNENLNGMSIGEYFQVPMKITINYEDILYITCKFSEKKPHNKIYIKLDLPLELNCIVLSYLYNYTYGEYKIIVPYDYPFKPPCWILINTNNKNNKNTNNFDKLNEKYKKAEIYQNAQYRNSWEPSISFEKDILYMIESINKM